MLEYIPILKDIDFESFYIRMNEMDFEGQKLAEKVYKVVLITCLVVSIVLSFFFQKMSYGVFCMMGGLVLAMLVSVPSWGCYNKNRLQWLPHKKEDVHKE